MSDIIFVILILISTLSLGAVVYFRSPRVKTNRLFAVMTFWIAIWITSNFLENEPIGSRLTALLLRLDFASAVLVFYFLYLFFLNFPQSKKLSRINSLLIFTPTLIFIVLSFTDLVIHNISFYENIHFETGVLYPLYSLYIIGYILAGCNTLFMKYRRAVGVPKIQILYVIIGFLISGLIAAIINLFLQQSVSVEMGRAGVYGITIMLAFITYAIVRHRLMDIRVVVRAITVYGISLVAAVGSGLLLMSLATHYLPYSGAVMGPIVLIFGILIYELVKEKFGHFANRYLFYPLYSAGETMAELSKKLSTFIDLGKLTFLTVNTIKEVMKLDKIGLILKKPTPPKGQLRLLGMSEAEELYLAQNEGFNAEEISSIFIKNKFLLHYLEKSNSPMIGDELESIVEGAKDERAKKKVVALKQYMEKIGAAVCLPLLIEDQLIGVFVLGKKVSGDAFSSQDLKLLETLSHQIAVAVNNAQLYEQAQYFNQILRARVIQATKELAQAYKELKKLDDSKTEFLSLASHQLRTPLSAVKGYISMVLEGDFGKLLPQTKEAIDRVYESNERLIRLVNDLLNVTRIEAGKLTYKPVKTDFEKLITGVIEELKMTAESKKLKLESVVKTKLPEIVIDPDKIREVVMNLVDNAIKYTEKGSVTVEAMKKGKEVMVRVKDTGIGISAEKLTSLFQWFSRGKGALRLDAGGFGLGLYIAKKIVERAGGRIWAESPGEGQGTTFIFSLPMEPPKENNNSDNSNSLPLAK